MGNRVERQTGGRPLFEEMEGRVLFSADGLGGIDPGFAASDEPVVEAGLLPVGPNAAPDSGVESAVHEADARREIVFIDAGVPDRQRLLDDLSSSPTGRSMEVVLLDGRGDSIAEISRVLSGHRGLDAVHVVSHGEDGAIRLGDTVLDLATLQERSEEVRGWGTALSESADVLLYGCDLAASDAGRTVVDAVSTLTGADVAASEDATGAAILGGDWDLEYRAGDIETVVAFTTQAQQTWSGVLATPPAITERQALDVDGNGQIDHVRFTTDQALDDDFGGLTVLVDGYALDGATPYLTSLDGAGNHDNVFYAKLQESGSPDTGATPLAAIMANTTLSEFGGSSNLVAEWWDTDWLARREITFDNTNSAENLTDFPVLVQLDPSSVDFARIKAGGADLRFVDEDGSTSLSFEIESWDDTPGSESATIWVKVPRIDAGSAVDSIWMYYDNAAAADGQTATSVWDSNYEAVLHAGEASGNLQDSTANNHDASARATPGYQATGRIGAAIDLERDDGDRSTLR